MIFSLASANKSFFLVTREAGSQVSEVLLYYRTYQPYLTLKALLISGKFDTSSL